ncbi:MAG: ATP-grasp domain-containing protein [Candidatus Scalindua sp.]
MKKLNIAVTGLNANDNPAPGFSISRAIRESQIPGIRIIGLTYDILSTGAYDDSIWDEVHILPYPSEGEAPLFSRLIEINKLTRLDIIIPSLDAEVMLYSALKSRLRNMGIKMLIPDRMKVKISSKQLLSIFCKEHNFNTPHTKIVYEFNDILQEKTIGYPSILKGSFTDARKINSIEEARVFFDRLSKEWGLPLVWQQFVSGEEYDVVALADEKSKVVGKVAMKKIALTEKGKGCAGITIGDKSILSLADEIIAALGWVGPLELEFIKEFSSDKMFLLEINSRFPAWVYLAVAAGQNLPQAVVKLLLGKKVTPFSSYKLGTIFVRTIEEHICSFEALGNLTTRGSLTYHNQKSRGSM